MNIINNWLLYVILYLGLATVFTQFYKVTTKTLKNAGALTVLLQLTAGISVLLLCPFFEFKFSTDIKVYIMFGLAIIFYTISDRINTTVRSGIEASTFSMLKQLSTTFMIFAGLIFFKEEFILTKFSMLNNVMQFLNVFQVFEVLVPVALVLGMGIGLFGSTITIRKHLKV